jgi:hypothetical protein
MDMNLSTAEEVRHQGTGSLHRASAGDSASAPLLQRDNELSLGALFLHRLVSASIG